MNQLSTIVPFGLKCRELRLKAGRRVIEHADMLDIEPAEITEYEVGLKIPDEHYIRATAYWLRVASEDLEALLARRSSEGQVVYFDENEKRELRRARRILKKSSSLSATILKLHDFQKGVDR